MAVVMCTGCRSVGGSCLDKEEVWLRRTEQAALCKKGQGAPSARRGAGTRRCRVEPAGARRCRVEPVETRASRKEQAAALCKGDQGAPARSAPEGCAQAEVRVEWR